MQLLCKFLMYSCNKNDSTRVCEGLYIECFYKYLYELNDIIKLTRKQQNVLNTAKSL